VISDDHTDDTLPTVVYYPATHAGAGAPADHAGGPYPLLVFSQGFDYAVSGYAYLLEHWAAAGFVVAAPTYPHTAPGSVLDEGDILNHPADLATVVHTLLSGPGTPAVLSGLVERSEVGLVGQSDGGDVTLAAADNTCCRVAGVKAAAILSGAELDSFGGSYFPSPSVPLLVVQGSADPINPPGCSAQLYDASPQPKHYLDLLGATHIAPYTEPGEDLSIVTAVTTDFFRATLDGNRSALRAAQAAGNVADVAELSSAPDAPQPLGPCPGAP
jgi:dienelactone hydrolase